MISHRIGVATFIVLLTVAGFFIFPGHTYLQQDTQIYLPMLERYDDPGVLSRDPVATHPHLAFTVYDEVTLGLRKLTGASFRTILEGQQIVFRAAGILGVFLIATSLGLGAPGALLVAGIYALGALISGPMVLTFEYEPIPRGFAVPLLIAAIGFAAHGRTFASEVCASIAFLYHPPTVWPFWAVYFILTLWPSNAKTMTRRIVGLIPIFTAVLIMLFLSRHQAGVTEPQPFFGTIPAEQAQIQRFRAPYNWVTIWWQVWIWHYLLLALIMAGALQRLWREASQELRFFAIGMTAAGLASIPLSYLLLERLRWTLIPQVQPVRALLFVTVFAVVLASAAAVEAARKGRWVEAFLWLLVPFGIPLQARVSDLLLPPLSNPLNVRRALLMAAFAAVGALAAWAITAKKRWWLAPLAAAVAAPILLAAPLGKVVNYPKTDPEQMDQLAAWARASTPLDAVFLFPDAGRDPSPGIFRAEAKRAVYTDWKSGGQVNFHREFGEEWRRRWQQTMVPKFDRSKLDLYRRLEIDYVVVQPKNALSDLQPVFRNSRFVVYKVS